MRRRNQKRVVQIPEKERLILGKKVIGSQFIGYNVIGPAKLKSCIVPDAVKYLPRGLANLRFDALVAENGEGGKLLAVCYDANTKQGKKAHAHSIDLVGVGLLPILLNEDPIYGVFCLDEHQPLKPDNHGVSPGPRSVCVNCASPVLYATSDAGPEDLQLICSRIARKGLTQNGDCVGFDHPFNRVIQLARELFRQKHEMGIKGLQGLRMKNKQSALRIREDLRLPIDSSDNQGFKGFLH